MSLNSLGKPTRISLRINVNFILQLSIDVKSRHCTKGFQLITYGTRTHIFEDDFGVYR